MFSPPLRPPLVVDHRLAELLLLLTSLVPHDGSGGGTSTAVQLVQYVRASFLRMRNKVDVQNANNNIMDIEYKL